MDEYTGKFHNNFIELDENGHILNTTIPCFFRFVIQYPPQTNRLMPLNNWIIASVDVHLGLGKMNTPHQTKNPLIAENTIKAIIKMRRKDMAMLSVVSLTIVILSSITLWQTAIKLNNFPV